MSAADARRVRTRFLVLRGLRWLPTGLQIPITVLLLTQRGFSLGQIGVITAAQGVMVLLLELPTGSLADAIGRRPVLLAATVLELLALALFIGADSLVVLIGVFALEGVYRALDSGPLDAWYVDAALAADPDADIEAGLGAGGVVLGVAVALGAVLAGGLVAVDPLPAVDALVTPLLVAAMFRVIETIALAALVSESRPGVDTRMLLAAPAQALNIARGAVRLTRGSMVLLALIAVELFWGFGMSAFEVLIAPRLAQVIGGAERAAAVLGPASSAAWLASAAGAAVVPWVSRRFGPALSAAGMRILQGLTVAGMALAAGPIGVLVAYLSTYGVHGAANPVHMGLLHRQVGAEHRTTVLSLNSMISQPGGALGGIVLGTIADNAGVPVAMLVGAVVLAAAAPLYLPARKQEARRPSQQAAVPSGAAG